MHTIQTVFTIKQEFMEKYMHNNNNNNNNNSGIKYKQYNKYFKILIPSVDQYHSLFKRLHAYTNMFT